MSARPAPAMVRASPLGLPFGLALFLLLVALCWVGFVGSDDVTYSRGAYGWIEQFPFVGGHGTIRYPLTIPMAVSLLALGENEYALVAPSLLYAVALIALIWWWVKRATDPVSAGLAVLALVTLPQLVVISTYANVEAVEALFLFLSIYLTWRCLDEGPEAGRLVLAGMFAGFAFLARETAIFVVPFYAALFLSGHRFHRGHYLWIVAGFLIVWAAELLYLGVMTGDPLYRIHVSLHHDPSIDRSVDLAGNIIVHPLIDPLLVLLLNQEFMLLFVLAIPLGAWLCFGHGVDERTRHFARIVSLFGLSWFLCAAAAQSLLPLNPRYFLISAICAAILTGVALARLLQSGKNRVRLAAGVAGLALLGANGLGLAAENKDLRFGERVLARIVAERPGQVIFTDPMTRYRADLLLRWASAGDRVGQRPPAAGDLFFHNPAHAEKGNARMSAALVPIYRPKPDWTAIARYEPDSPYLARTIEGVGLAELIPGSIWRKLRFRHAPVTLYRVGGEGSTGAGARSGG
jgi:4-amino-4-deoxy-L-arabinose transferase-like glycosyltransferase